jgi:cytochrome c biogenesis protein CcdA
MAAQNQGNHRRLSPMYHGVLFSIVLACVGLSVYWLAKTADVSGEWLPQVVLVLLSFGLLLVMLLARTFALKAQDRAIRAEESLRHFILTAKPINPNLTLGQIIALRFASDDELVGLTEMAIEQKMTSSEIKSKIRNWKADTHRV